MFECVAIVLQVVLMALNGIEGIKIMLHVGRSILFYPWGGLWYIQAVLVAIILLVPFIKKGCMHIAIVTGLPLYLFALICNRYYFIVVGTRLEGLITLFNTVFAGPRNGLLYGLLFVAIGLRIAKYWDKLKGHTFAVEITLVITFILLTVEFLLIKGKPGTDDASLYIMNIFVAPSLFVVAAQHKKCPITNTRVLRNLSTSIYLLHSPIIDALHIINMLLFGREITCIPLNLQLFVILTTVLIIVYKTKIQPIYDLIV